MLCAREGCPALPGNALNSTMSVAPPRKKLQKYAGVLTTAPRLCVFDSEQMCSS